jgi:hypothetical protein
MRREAWEEYAEAKAKREAVENGNVPVNSVRTKQTPAQKAARLRRTNIEFDSISGIEGRAGLPLDPQQSPVIPADFLWHVFESLVDALTIPYQ